ncbi:MAG: hypothetical protein ACX939_03895 [Hyphococcus sp.]
MRIFAAIAALILLSGCGGGKDLAAVAPGEVIANTLIIFDNGMQVTLGEQVLSANGDFVPAGPTVIYVFRNIPEQAAQQIKKDGLKVEPHTAYQLTAGERVDQDALRNMKPVGRVDAGLSENAVIALFTRQPETSNFPANDDREALKAVVQLHEDMIAVAQARMADISEDDPKYDELLAEIRLLQADLAVAVAELEQASMSDE